MLKLILVQISFVFMAIVVVDGLGTGIQYKGNVKHPDQPHQCYFAEHKLSIPVNETIYPKNLNESCIKVFCRDDFVLEIKHCRNTDPRSECELTSPNDYTKPFPECCAIKTCKDKRVLREEDY